jgi:hypothetical protein
LYNPICWAIGLLVLAIVLNWFIANIGKSDHYDINK